MSLPAGAIGRDQPCGLTSESPLPDVGSCHGRHTVLELSALATLHKPIARTLERTSLPASAMSLLCQPQFHNEAAAFSYIEAALWPGGPVCPHCAGTERISAIRPNPERRVRMGLKFCGRCHRQFTVRIGTVFEESKLPMTKWLQAIHLLCCAQKDLSPHQVHSALCCDRSTALFLLHRIRRAAGEFRPVGRSVSAEAGEDEAAFKADIVRVAATPRSTWRRGSAQEQTPWVSVAVRTV